jgi:hypothetical protein
MTTLKLRNDQERPMQLLLDASGHCYEMPPGSFFEVLPQLDHDLEIVHHDAGLIILGAVAKVVHEGQVVGSWERGADEAGARMPGRIDSLQAVRSHLESSGQRVVSAPDGVQIIREAREKSWVVNVRWRDEHDLLLVEAATGIRAVKERERDLALAISRIHTSNAIAGFQLVHLAGGGLNISYRVHVLMEERRSVPTTVLDRAIAVCFDIVLRYTERLAAVASGDPDPGTP